MAVSQCARLVAIGDVHGAFEILFEILRGLQLVDRRQKWIGKSTHLIQLGDLFNRGGGARDAIGLLQDLQRQAPACQGRVTVLLRNHEVMTSLRNEAYCTVEEYLAFATQKEQRAWPQRVKRAAQDILRGHPPGGPILPLHPRLANWMVENVPGKSNLRRTLRPRGQIGRAIRQFPIAVVDHNCVFVHAPITPRCARLGVDGLNGAARKAWKEAPEFYRDLPQKGIFNDKNGPLWNRALIERDTAKTRRQLERALFHLGARRMIVGHHFTGRIPGGTMGRIASRHQGRLVCIDVGLGRIAPSPRTALVIEDGVAIEWTPAASRVLWQDTTDGD